jgi:uncharacterized Rmd1/YagE family protein
MSGDFHHYGATDDLWIEKDEIIQLEEQQPLSRTESVPIPEEEVSGTPTDLRRPAPTPVFGRKKQLSLNQQMTDGLSQRRVNSSGAPQGPDFNFGRPEDLVLLGRSISMGASSSKSSKLPSKTGQNTRARKNVGAYRRRRQDFDTWKGRVGVHVPVDQIHLKALVSVILDHLPGWDLIDHYDVIRVWMPCESSSHGALSEHGNGGLSDVSSQDASMPEVYVFSFGGVVFWNFQSEFFEKAWIDRCLLRHADIIGEVNDPSAMENACDEMGFIYGDSHKIFRDVIQLSTRDSAEKLAVSFAFAKSALLSIFEWRLEKTIERNSHIPEELAKTGHINLSRAEISKEIGRIYLVKHGIHLDNSLLDTPEEFWEGKLIIFFFFSDDIRT